MNIFDGLEEVGLDDLTQLDVYQKVEEGIHQDAALKMQKTGVNEADILFEKSYECVVCGKPFKAKTVRTGKVRSEGRDRDLKPNYNDIEPLKYDIIACPHCGYAVPVKYYATLAPTQNKLIKEKISSNFRAKEENGDTYSFEYAIYLYKLALACAVVKMSKDSEKAYICLRAGWVVRSYIRELEKSKEDEANKIAEMSALEEEFIRKAYDGYLSALAKELPPISGMDERTLDYLLAVLGCRFDDIDTSVRLVQKILLSKDTPKRIKDMTLVIKDELLEKVKAKK